MNRMTRLVLTLAMIAIVVRPAYAARPPKRHQMGPTGILGFIEDLTLTVETVEKGSPADGKIKKGDKIAGINGTPFKSDLRREFAGAIDEAERAKSGGVLILDLENGNQAQLQLQILGTYSARAPYGCLKSNKIITQAADYLLNLVKSPPKPTSNPTQLGWSCLEIHYLALMATGEDKYIDLVKERLPKSAWANPTEDDISELMAQKNGHGEGWVWGYRLIAMGEYYLLTKDKSVLPGMRIYAAALARGQHVSGTWGHGVAKEVLQGRLEVYATMNQPTMTSLMGLLFARKCGIETPETRRAISKAYTYLCYYIGRGEYPYAINLPALRVFNNNGTSASSALMMSMQGNKKGADFFMRLAAASHNELEIGHHSWAWNVLWSPLGVNVAGPIATQAFFKESRWLHTLYRRWQGDFSRDGVKEPYLNSTASHLLAYCLPRKAIYLTGKDADESLWLKPREAHAAVAVGKIDYANASAPTLVELLGHPLPHVRQKAGKELIEKGKRVDGWLRRENLCTSLFQLTEAMRSGPPLQRLGAVSLFDNKYALKEATVCIELLGSILRNKNEDAWLRVAAAKALCLLKEDAYAYYNDIIAMILEQKADDPYGNMDWVLCASLNKMCKDPFGAGLVKSPEAFYAAALKLADNTLQRARGEGMKMLAHMPLEDFPLVADSVLHVIKNDDPTYHTYHSPVVSVLPGIAVLANLNIREGMSLALEVLSTPWGLGAFKRLACWRALEMYGSNAKEAQKQALEHFYENTAQSQIDVIEGRGGVQGFRDAIQKDENPKALITLEEAGWKPVKKERAK